MSQTVTFDPFWEETRKQGRHITRYPYDFVVSFVYRNAPKKPRDDTWILEVGCSGGNNLWFAAREGFKVAGIDGSATAIDYAKNRFLEEGLGGVFRVADFTQLPFEDDLFDLVIDRGSITCSGFSGAKVAVAEVRRVLVEGGKFLFNPYSKRHTSFHSGRPGPDGLIFDISRGRLVDSGQIAFYDKADVEAAIGSGWVVEQAEHLELVDHAQLEPTIHADWRFVLRKSS